MAMRKKGVRAERQPGVRGGGKLMAGRAGDVLRNLRETARLTQSELAERVGISYQQVQKYEYGGSEMTLTRLSQIARALGVPQGMFIDEEPGTSAPILSERERMALTLMRRIEAKGLGPMALGVLEVMAG